MNKFSLLPSTQSGFRVGHSTETTLVKLYNDLILSADKGNLSVLLCLDFSSAFDTVDHSVLLSVLEKSFGVSGSSLSWFQSYLSNRSYVFLNASKSDPVTFDYGVPQGSILGPLLFILYTSELPQIISSFSLNSQLYADDSYIYSSFPKSSLNSVLTTISACLEKIISWSTSMYLKLNPSKFELIFFNNTRSTITFPSLRLSSIDSFSLGPSPVIRSRGFFFESNLSPTHQIS